jgi:hypothetical protein
MQEESISEKLSPGQHLRLSVRMDLGNDKQASSGALVDSGATLNFVSQLVVKERATFQHLCVRWMETLCVLNASIL